MASSALILAFPAAMFIAAALDVLTLTIPNRLSVALIIAFAISALLSGLPWPDVVGHVSAAAAVLALGIALFASGWIGGGDAKLLAATTLWLGFEHLAAYLTTTTLFGGLLAILILTYRSFAIPRCLLGQQWALRLHRPGEGIPYGVALAGAGLWIYSTGKWVLLPAA